MHEDNQHGKKALHEIVGHDGGAGQSHDSLHKIEDRHHKSKK